MTSISPAAPVQVDSATAQATPTPKSATQPFFAFLKFAAQENSGETGTEPHAFPFTRPSDKDQKEKAQPKNAAKDGLVTAVASLPVPQVQDPRALLLSWRRQEDAPKRDNAAQAVLNAGADATKNAISTDLSASPAIQQAPVAFSVTVPKNNGPEHREFAPMSHVEKNAGATVQTQKSASSVEKPAVTHRSSSDKQQHPSSKDEGEQQARAVTNAAANATHSAHESVRAVSAVSGPATVANDVPQAYTATQATEVKKSAAVAPSPQVAAVTEPREISPVRPQNIELKVASHDNTQVDVRVSQRAGDVQVTVRTPDTDLAQSLRQHLPELSDRLAQTGVHGDIWHPGATQTSTNTSSDNSESWSQDGGQYQQQGDSNHRSNQGQQQENERSTWFDELDQAANDPTEQSIPA